MTSLKPLLATVAFIAACGSSGGTRTAQQDAPQPRAMRYDTVAAGQPTSVLVEIGEMIADECDVPAGKAYFNYASDSLDAQDRVILSLVAECMKTGALANKPILLIGYTDYRGGYDNNDALGLERSKVVAAELVKHGVSPDRIFVRTWGERGANYPDFIEGDRRVELRLVEPDTKTL